MAEASIKDGHQVLTFVLLMLLPLFLAWFSSLSEATIAQLFNSHSGIIYDSLFDISI
jgi:hypothetical protein